MTKKSLGIVLNIDSETREVKARTLTPEEHAKAEAEGKFIPGKINIETKEVEEEEEKPRTVLRTIPGTDKTKELYTQTLENSVKIKNEALELKKKLDAKIEELMTEKSRFWTLISVEMGIFGGDYGYDDDKNEIKIYRE